MVKAVRHGLKREWLTEGNNGAQTKALVKIVGDLPDKTSSKCTYKIGERNYKFKIIYTKAEHTSSVEVMTLFVTELLPLLLARPSQESAEEREV